MFSLLSLIFRNISRNRRRTLLTLASTAISLALLAILLSIYQGMFYGEDVSPSAARRMFCRHRVSLAEELPASYLAPIVATPGVQHVTSFSWFAGTYGEKKNDRFIRFAVNAESIFDVHEDWIVAPDQLAAFKKQRTACAVGEAIAEKYHMKLGERVTIVGDIYPVTLEMTVAAIFKHPPATEALVFHQEYLDELLPASSVQKNTVGSYLLLAERPEDVPRISNVVDAMFDNSPYPTRTESEKEFGRSFLAFLGNIKLFFAAICGAVTFTILLVSANTIAMAVRERTREMAIMRTLGFSPGEILQMVLAEAVALSLAGGVVGLGIAIAVVKSMRQFGLQPVRWEVAISVLGIATVIGLLAAVVPAYFASRRNVVESLRFVG